MNPTREPLTTRLLVALARRLYGTDDVPEGMVGLADHGLAHAHVRLPQSPWLARVPKHSQVNLPPAEHLAYEAACFTRAAPSGHTPRLHRVLAPAADLPWGALLVEWVPGEPARAHHMVGPAMDALAALHRLPLPPVAERAPLLHPADPVAGLMSVLHVQAPGLQHPSVPAATRAVVLERLATLPSRLARACTQAPLTLIAFDAHPGNFIVRPDGKVVLVDLEKMRYSLAPLDLAHATLHTSTTWDRATAFELSPDDVAQACHRWLAAMGPLADGYRTTLLPLREAMWLWSLTWCAQWQASSGLPPRTDPRGVDWSSEHHSDALTRHVAERVAHYLSPECVGAQLDELDALSRRLAA